MRMKPRSSRVRIRVEDDAVCRRWLCVDVVEVRALVYWQRQVAAFEGIARLDEVAPSQLLGNAIA